MINHELDKLYAMEAYNDKVIVFMETQGLDTMDEDAWEQACIDYDDYCRSLHEDCEVV